MIDFFVIELSLMNRRKERNIVLIRAHCWAKFFSFFGEQFQRYFSLILSNIFFIWLRIGVMTDFFLFVVISDADFHSGGGILRCQYVCTV